MLEIDFVGYEGTHPKGFVYGLPPGHDSYLLLLTSTPAEFYIGEEFRKFPAGTAILYTPGSRVLYRACEDVYINDWIRFRCDENFVEQLPLKNQPFPVGDAEYCHNLFKLLTWESTLSSDRSREIQTQLLHTLFLKLGESCQRPMVHPHAQEMLDLRKRIYNNPSYPWNVESMAQELHLSTGYLQTLYKNMFGSSCMEDVILQRLHRSKDQLLSTSKSIREIAENCGYNNVEHYCRQFRKFMGCSPSRYRRDTGTGTLSRDTGTDTLSHSDASSSPKAPEHLTLGGRDLNL